MRETWRRAAALKRSDVNNRRRYSKLCYEETALLSNIRGWCYLYDFGNVGVEMLKSAISNKLELYSKAPLHVIMYSLIDNAGIATEIICTG